MKKIFKTVILLLPACLSFAQQRMVVDNGAAVVISSGTSAKPTYLVIADSNANAITRDSGYIYSENEFNIVQWNISNNSGNYVVPFGYSSSLYLPLSVEINTNPGSSGGSMKFSTYHTAALNSSAEPSDVTNVTPFILPGSPSNTDNSYNIADRFFIIDANTGYTTKPAPDNISFSYISGTSNSEVTSPNTLTQSRLMAQRFNSTTSTWSDWFGYGCTDAVTSNIGTVSTGPVTATNMYRSWSLWDNTTSLPLTITGVNATSECTNNGSATATVYGGKTPYTYSWSPSGGSAASATGLSGGTYTVTITDVGGCSSTGTVTIIQPTALSITASTDANVTCSGDNNGSISATVTGGISPYTYSWSGDGGSNSIASGLVAGTYTLSVTDNNGCTGSASSIITQPANGLSVAATTTANVGCNILGSASSNVSGGTSPYTYSWSGGAGNTDTATGLIAGSYTLTVTDANGCTNSAGVTISQPANSILASAGTTNITCNGGSDGSALSTTTGGILPYTYLWSSGEGTNSSATGLTAGTYSLTVTDNIGCASSTIISITQPNPISNNASVVSNVLCKGGNSGSASANASGGTTPYTYLWNDGSSQVTATGLVAGTYTVTITDACGSDLSSTASVIISQPTILSNTTVAVTNVTCNGVANGSASVNTSGGGTPYTYTWSNGATTKTIVGLSTGTYSVTIKDACGADSTMSFTITQPSELRDSVGVSNITCNGGTVNAIANVGGGNSPYTYLWSNSQTAATATGLSAGTYSVSIKDVCGADSIASITITQPAELIVSVDTVTNVSCNGGNNGSATATANGGTTPYTYLWNNSQATSTATGLVAGTYTLSVTDACGGDLATASIIIEQPTNALAITIASYTNVVCNGGIGGATTDTATGGAVPYTDLLDFNNTNGENPNGSLILLGTTLYGMTEEGGADSDGCIFSMNEDGTGYTDLLDFDGTNGLYPEGSLILSGTTLYGMTQYGAIYGDGNIFSFNTNGNVYTDLLDFDGTNGANPEGSLIFSGTTLYGMTVVGGLHGLGCAFSFNTNGNVYTDLINFTGTTGSYPGHNPYGSLILSGTTLYGMTYAGGAHNDGNIFSFNTNGNRYTNLFTFDGTNGRYPNGSFTISGTILYGMTTSGGAYNDGDIFTFNTVGNVYTDLLDFNVTSGGSPYGSLILSGTTLYGMTQGGGANGIGVVFSFNTTGNVYTDMLDFDGGNGANPLGDLTLSGTTLYGMTQNGGASGEGNVFSINPPYSYSWSPSGGSNLTATGLSAGSYTITVTDGNGCNAVASVTITQPSELRDSVSVSNVTCNGGTGSAMVNVGGGTSPYTYLWNDASSQTTAAATGLVVGTYSVSIKDACGADSTVRFTITQPAMLGNTTIAVIANVTCSGDNNGSASVNPSGGSTPYTYVWSNGASAAIVSGLTAGTYSVSIKDACGADSLSHIITITQPLNGLSVSAATTGNVSCNTSGSTASTLSGGTSPYTYSWSGGGGTNSTASGLVAGTYTLSVTDANGCTSSNTTIITQPAGSLEAFAGVAEEVTCNSGNNGAATASPTGGSSPYTYLWSDGSSQTTVEATELIAGTYTLGVTDANGCTSSTSIVISQPNVLGSSSINTYANVTCNNGNSGSATVTPSGGGTPYTYSWSNGESSATATGLSAGTYSVSVMDACGADLVSNIITITQPNALGNVIASVTSNVSCNGTNSGSASVSSPSGGSTPYTYLWSNGEATATTTGLSAGTYNVSVQDNCGADSISNTITITQPNNLGNVIASVTSNGTCNGTNSGSASLSATGGNTPYTYLWSNGEATATATGLSAGTYNVSVMDACGADSLSHTITITQPNALGNVIASITANVACNGTNSGSASVSPSGGNTPYTYVWSNGESTASATGLSAGTYSVSVLDACGADSISNTITITQPNSLGNVIASVAVNITCNGATNGSASVSPSGGNTPYTYVWSNGETTANATVLGAGTYNVSVMDACGADSISNTIIITQPNSLGNVIASVTSNVICNGSTNGSASVSASGGGIPYTYTWSNGESTASATGLSAGTYNVSIMDACGADSSSHTITITQPTSLGHIIASVTSNVICNGSTNGSASVSASGGGIPYTYTWSNGESTASATGLSAGTYSVSVKDNCGADSISTTITITESNSLGNVIASVTGNVTCNGINSGSASVSASGGNTPYTYAWSSGETTASATGLSAGTYSVSVMDACGADSLSNTITITQPAMLSNTHITVIANVTCHGDNNGSASVNPSGGSLPYIYTWSNGETTATASNLTAGTYSVSIKDACGADSLSNTITISQPANALTAIVSTTDVTCSGDNNGSASSTVSGGTSPYTYAWTGGGGTNADASSLTAGTYTLSITDKNGCIYSTTAVITQPTTSLTVTGYSKKTQFGACDGIAAVTASGGVAPYTYLWTTGSQTIDTIKNQCFGTYCCKVTDANGCTQSICIQVDTLNTTGVNTIAPTTSINIYPNPTIGSFTITGVSEGQIIEIYDYLGQKLSSTTVSNNTTMHFDISTRANGMYLVRILNTDGTLATEKKMIKAQ